MLYNRKVFLPMSVKRLVVHSLVLRAVRLGITLFFYCSDFWYTKINNILNIILESDAYNTRLSPSGNIFQSLSFPSMKKLFAETVVLARYCNTPFRTRRRNICSCQHVTRFMTPQVRARYGRYERYFHVPSVLNSLADDIFDDQFTNRLERVLSSLS